jgi:hypothetical protein
MYPPQEIRVEKYSSKTATQNQKMRPAHDCEVACNDKIAVLSTSTPLSPLAVGLFL